MEPETYRAILKRVAWVLVLIGLIDVGVMVYCIVNGQSYSSSFNLFAVIAGIFLLRGGLRTAALVRWFSVFMLAGFLSIAVVAPFLQPWELSLTELHLNPGTFTIGAIFYFFALGFLFWVARQLGLEPVQAAIAKAGVKRRDARYAVAAGVGLAVLLGIAVPLISNGESAQRAKSIAQQEVGPGYQFHVSSIQVSMLATEQALPVWSLHGTIKKYKCALLVSVDRDLLDTQRINEIPIIRPGEYWRRAAEGS